MQVASIGLYFFNARWYDSALGRFVQADTIIPNPGDPPSFDRFSYVRNNPIRFTDPTGNWYYDPGCDCLVDTHESYNEHPEYLDREPLPTPEFELPPPVPVKYQDQLSESQWNLARWAYAVYWSNPTLFTYNEFVWFWAWAYWEYSAAYYDLDEPWYTPPDMAPFMVPNFVELAGTVGATMGGMLGGPIPSAIGNLGANKVGQATGWDVRQYPLPGRRYDGLIPSTG
jgi:RHS repeat-associated protein